MSTTYRANPYLYFASNTTSFPSASLARLKSSVASIVTIAHQRDALAEYRPDGEEYRADQRVIHSCSPGHTLLPKPKMKLTLSSVNIPSASKNLSGMNFSALGYRVSSRVIALTKILTFLPRSESKGRQLYTKYLQR